MEFDASWNRRHACSSSSLEVTVTRSMTQDHGAEVWGIFGISRVVLVVTVSHWDFASHDYQMLLLMVIVIVMIIIAEMSIIIFPSLPSFLPFFPLRSRTPLPFGGRSTTSSVCRYGPDLFGKKDHARATETGTGRSWLNHGIKFPYRVIETPEVLLCLVLS